MGKAPLNFYFRMDGIRRKPTIPKTESIQAPVIQQSQPIPYFQKKEELYIPKEETISEEKIEKKFQKWRWIRKSLWILFLIVTISIVSLLFFFLWKTYATTKKMNVSEKQTTLSQDVKTILAPIIPSANKHFLRGESEGRVNILLLGAAGENKPGGNLTDTVMVMSIDTKNQKVALLSLPRDFYVPIGETNTFTKLNSLYKIGIAQNKGVDLTKQAVEKITGLTINYYMAVNFDAFSKIIDNINGINITVERDIYDATYPGPNYSYELFALKKGTYLLGGDVALKYVRERHDDPEGDFGRAKRQQQVIQAVKSRMFSMQTLFNVFAISKVLDTLGNNIKTDMSFDDIEQFISLSKHVDTQNITNVVVDAWKADSLLKVSHVMVGDVRAFILVPRIGNYSEIQDLAINIFDQAEMKRRQESIQQEDASIEIINQSGNSPLANKIKKLLNEKFGMKKVTIVNSEKSQQTISETIIIANSNTSKIFTLDELIKKLPARIALKKTDEGTPENIETPTSESASDIIIKLGSDLVDIYKYEEDTMQDLQSADDNQLTL